MGADVCRQQLAPVDYLTSATTDDTGAVLRMVQQIVTGTLGSDQSTRLLLWARPRS